jgi:hypothetical protein
MAITYPISIPATPGFRSIKWMAMSVVGEQPSIFTLSTKVYAWPGKLRRVTVTLPPMDEVNAKLWTTFAMKLNGKEGTFFLQDSLFKSPRGVVADQYALGKVNGASQAGSSLITDGWAVSQTDLFKEGDWISVEDRLYSILEDVDSDGSGNATLTLWPDVISPADDASILVGSDARGIFRLEDWPENGWDEGRLCSGFTFTAKEDI